MKEKTFAEEIVEDLMGENGKPAQIYAKGVVLKKLARLEEAEKEIIKLKNAGARQNGDLDIVYDADQPVEEEWRPNAKMTVYFNGIKHEKDV